MSLYYLSAISISNWDSNGLTSTSYWKLLLATHTWTHFTCCVSLGRWIFTDLYNVPGHMLHAFQVLSHLLLTRIIWGRWSFCSHFTQEAKHYWLWITGSLHCIHYSQNMWEREREGERRWRKWRKGERRKEISSIIFRIWKYFPL